MNTHDIELPQGYAERPFDYSGDLYTEGQVRAAIEADRKRRGEPETVSAQPAASVEPVAWYTEDHLADKSATTWDQSVAARWRAKGWPVYPLYAAQSSGRAQQDAEPDMYWDADDPERFGAMDLHGAVEYMMDSYTISDLPMTLSLLCARSMPNVEVRVTGYTDDDGWQYEVIDAARKGES